MWVHVGCLPDAIQSVFRSEVTSLCDQGVAHYSGSCPPSGVRCVLWSPTAWCYCVETAFQRRGPGRPASSSLVGQESLEARCTKPDTWTEDGDGERAGQDKHRKLIAFNWTCACQRDPGITAIASLLEHAKAEGDQRNRNEDTRSPSAYWSVRWLQSLLSTLLIMLAFYSLYSVPLNLAMANALTP
jgi:hypothetical protein